MAAAVMAAAAMRGLTCNACNKEFVDDKEQKQHYRTEWHRYNLKRKVAGVPGVTEALFQARQYALEQANNKSSETPMLYGCSICGKEYRSSKAHDQHLNSRAHAAKASLVSDSESTGITIIKPLSGRDKSVSVRKHPPVMEEENEDSEDEWVEVNSDDELDVTTESLNNMQVDEKASGSGANDQDVDDQDEMDEDVEVDPSCCFVCDQNHDSIESCMVHMHKQHGFFIPDIEYLKDPRGFLTYLGLKVTRDYVCLYCNDRCQPFQSLEAVRKHMIAKAHCKVRYGDGAEDEEADLEDFYDYSSSYVDGDEKQLVASDGLGNNIELGNGGYELVIRRNNEGKTMVRTLGSREFLRYYRQKPRPAPARDAALAIALASRYRSMGLTTVQSRENVVRMKVLREMNRRGVDVMRSKIGMKSNVIRNLPKNVPH